MRALLVPARHPLWSALECRHRHDTALQVQRPAFLSPLYHSHSVRICSYRLLVGKASEHRCEADMDFPAYSICDLCGLDCSEVLRRARSRLAEPSLRSQAEFQHQASDRLITGRRVHWKTRWVGLLKKKENFPGRIFHTGPSFP